MSTNHEHEPLYRRHASSSRSSSDLTANLLQDLTVEFLALAPNNTGGSWLVDIFDRTAFSWTPVGNLSSAGDDWTLVFLTLTSRDFTVYLDTIFNEILVRVIADSADSELVSFCSSEKPNLDQHETYYNFLLVGGRRKRLSFRPSRLRDTLSSSILCHRITWRCCGFSRPDIYLWPRKANLVLLFEVSFRLSSFGSVVVTPLPFEAHPYACRLTSFIGSLITAALGNLLAFSHARPSALHLVPTRHRRATSTSHNSRRPPELRRRSPPSMSPPPRQLRPWLPRPLTSSRLRLRRWVSFCPWYTSRAAVNHW